MGFFRRLLKTERSMSAAGDWTPIVMGAASATGINVTPENAMRSAAVLACVRVLAETVAGLPFIVYRRGQNGRERDTSLPLYNLLSSKPNRYQTAFEFREMLMAHCLLRGNGYAQKVYDGSGRLAELVPLNPTKVEPVLNPDGSLVYKFRTENYGEILIPGEDVFHLKGLATDGVLGVSPITYAREAVGLSIATEEFGARVFSNDAKPGGILEHPGKLTDEAHKRIKDSWQAAHAGLKNAHKVAVLEEGMKWQRIGISASDTQFIEARKFQIEEIARIFRVPPHLIGHLERATFANIEHQSLEFVQHTLLPWLRRWEQAISTRLMSEQESISHYSEFLVDGLLRGDIQSRYSAYAVGRQWGWLSADDVRRLENMEPLPQNAGTDYLVPLNMIPAGTTPTDPPPVRASSALALKPILRQLIERYSERVDATKKPLRSHEKVIFDGLIPTLRAFIEISGKTATDQDVRTCFDALLNKWESGDVADVDAKVEFVVGFIDAMKGE